MGELDRSGGQGFVVGLAPLDSRPPAAAGDTLPRRAARILDPASQGLTGGGTAGSAGTPPESPTGGGLAASPSGRLSRKGSTLLAELAGSGAGAGSETNALFLRYKHETLQVGGAGLSGSARGAGLVELGHDAARAASARRRASSSTRTSRQSSSG